MENLKCEKCDAVVGQGTATGRPSGLLCATCAAVIQPEPSPCCDECGGGGAHPCWLVFRGQTDGLATNETSLLRYGCTDNPVSRMPLKDGRAYNFTLTAIINGVQDVTNANKTITKKFNARCVAGVAVIASSGADDTYGEAAAETWIITPAAVDNTIEFTFDTGAGTASLCKVAAHLRWQEVIL